MLSRLRRFGVQTAALACAGLLLSSAPALADLSCSISSINGKSPPLTQTASNPKGFRIFWHVATLIEDIADAEKDPAALADIRAASKMVDGYYFNMLFGGPLIYWPDRPRQCELNFKRIEKDATIELDGAELDFPEGGTAARNSCIKAQEDFLAHQDRSRDTPKELQFDAMRRAVKVLDIADARRRGIPIWGATIIRNTDFSYQESTDQVHLTTLPATYCGLADAGFLLDGMMVYQEHKMQQEQGKFLHIPRKSRKGRLVYSDNLRRDKIPENTRAFKLIADAFTEAHVPVRNLRANIRRWIPKRSPQMAKELAAIPAFGGFNFEGGTRLITNEDKYINNFIEGMSWVLKNTDRDISLLMPGYWTRDKIGNDAEIDELIGRFRKTILLINTKLSNKMGLKAGQNAICTNRLVFIPATYGQPVHVRTVPMMRNGHLAGTVTGEIKLLTEIRKELCGV